MCTPSIPQDNSAQLAQQQADQRQSQITQGQGSIDSAFSKFDDGYFKQYGDAYTANYDPQVDQQYGIAKQKDNYDAARKGVLDSTPAIHQADLLNTSYGDQRQQVASDALAAVNNQKNAINSQKSQLYALNTSSADPTQAASQANASAGTFSSQPQYSALGDLFGGLVNTGTAVLAGRGQVNPYLTPGGSPTSALPSGSGSARIVS